MVGDFGLFASGTPMNFTPRPLRHEENVLSALKNFVCGSCDASGMVSAVAPDAPLAPDAPALPTIPTPRRDRGRAGPLRSW